MYFQGKIKYRKFTVCPYTRCKCVILDKIHDERFRG